MLAGLTLEDVAKAGEVPDDAVAHRAIYRLFDGMVITMQGWQAQDSPDGNPGKAQATFEIALDEAQARATIIADIEREQAASVAQENGAPATGENAASTSSDDEATPPADAGTTAASGKVDPAGTATADTNDNAAATEIDAEAEMEKRLSALRAQVDAMNARLQGWRFEIPPYKFANVDKTLDDMLKPAS
jgi:hypothetical protein